MSDNISLPYLHGLGCIAILCDQKKDQAQEDPNCQTIAVTSHASKIKLKILSPNFTKTWNKNYQMYKLDSEEAEAPKATW